MRTRRLRLCLLLFTVICALVLLLYIDLEPEDKCQHFISRRVAFGNCSGCFQTSHYPQLINQPHICATAKTRTTSGESRNQTIDIVFVLFTNLHDVDRRNLLRKTWASASRNNTANFRHVFMLGTNDDHRLMAAVRRESRVYRDVVVTDFRDSYLNLTLKTMTSLHWLSRHCSHARFFLKIDDDVWINTGALLPILSNYATALQTAVGGKITTNGKIFRDPENKWYASCRSYPDRRYPTYAQGAMYVSSLRMARLLSSRCQDVPFFHMEDVFLGLCHELLGLTVVDMPEMKLWDPNSRGCKVKDYTVAVLYPVTVDQIKSYWRTLPCSGDGG